jgi:hypothetical protein
MMRPPRFVAVVVVTVLLSLLTTTLVAWRVDAISDDEEARDCQRSVDIRLDNRTMWLYLVDTTTEPDSRRVKEFLIELDKRLPELKCVDGNPVPVEELNA